VAGQGSGRALVTDEPLSFWGGVDAQTGEIIDRHHPLLGECLTGRVLVLPHGRGSCSASGVLLEAIVGGTGPAAILTTRLDPILGLGSILAEELHGLTVPVVVLDPSDAAKILAGDEIDVDRDGTIRIGAAG
jgi:predicted aconitase with swiveling domain